jgi:uncharacterized protein YjiS (DUF1127 family)
MDETAVLGRRNGHREERQGTDERLRLLVRWLLHCHERTRQRQQLGALEPHLRDDVGLTESEVMRELEKPFWR